MNFLKQARDGEYGDDNTSFAGIYLITFWNSINSVAPQPLGIARMRMFPPSPSIDSLSKE